jgi:hypothetical protein
MACHSTALLLSAYDMPKYGDDLSWRLTVAETAKVPAAVGMDQDRPVCVLDLLVETELRRGRSAITRYAEFVLFNSTPCVDALLFAIFDQAFRGHHCRCCVDDLLLPTMERLLLPLSELHLELLLPLGMSLPLFFDRWPLRPFSFERSWASLLLLL